MSLLSLLESIDGRDFSPIVVVPSEGMLADRLMNIPIPVMVSPLYDGSRKQPFPLLQSVWRLLRLIEQERIALVHANIERCNRPVAIATKIARVPQICHVRNIQTRDSFRHFFLKIPPYLIANSQATSRSYAAYLRNSQKSYVVYNGVDLDRFDGSRYPKSRFGIPEDAYMIAQISRITAEKGVHLFVESLSKISVLHPNAYGLIAGDTSVHGSEEYLLDLRKKVAELGLREKVKFVGRVDDVVAVYGASDLVVQPSISEPFGRTLIEAMAMGVPVIGTRAGGAMEVVEDGVTGLLVPPNRSDELTMAILTCMNNKQLAEKMGRDGRERVKRLFTAEKHARRLQELYVRILEAHW